MKKHRRTFEILFVFEKKEEKDLFVPKKLSTFATLLSKRPLVKHWKGGRVVDYSGLENRRAERHRGFESLPFRREDEQRELLVFLLYVLEVMEAMHTIKKRRLLAFAFFIEHTMLFAPIPVGSRASSSRETHRCRRDVRVRVDVRTRTPW